MEKKIELTFRLPGKYYDALERLAKDREISVDDMAKLLLIRKIDEEVFLMKLRRDEFRKKRRREDP
ncbi:hypothetical protein [Metallosphaera sedula]|uniref:hypothetical protein n=1 Tax=Metallosphaera sedula TaxID=43687 RepID=UPI0020C188BE|nr:hypothetical protein [Metallosphaera sedula]BBL48321.1 hypothetical protein MJ1HA_2443 [Metallosphaera sedula]